MLINKTDTILIEKTSNVATDVISPIIEVFAIPAKLIANGYDYFRDLKQIHADNMRLKEENRKLNMLYDKFKSLEIENRLLADLLNYVTPPKSDFITARVIAEEDDAFSHSMIAYIGDKIVKKGQIAMSDRGVVGRVHRVGRAYARVLLITDINSKIPVMIESSRIRGILAGDNTSLPKLVFTPLDAVINIGDRVVTSGVAGVFPAGLPIGRVVSVNKNEIIVKPFGALEQLEYIRLVDYGLEGLLQNENKMMNDEAANE